MADVGAAGKQQVLEARDSLARARVLARFLDDRTRTLRMIRKRLVIPRHVDWN